MEKLNIYQKLLSIQQHVDSFVKNKKAFNYSYVDGNQVLNEIRPLMNGAQLLLKQEVLSMVNERYDYSTSKGIAKTEVLSCLEMRFTWIDCETGEKDENLFCANGMNDFDKGVGSALTYGERYFLLKFFHIPTDADDVDNIKRDVVAVKLGPKPQPVKEQPKKVTLSEIGFKKLLDRIILGEVAAYDHAKEFFALSETQIAQADKIVRNLPPVNQLKTA